MISPKCFQHLLATALLCLPIFTLAQSPCTCRSINGDISDKEPLATHTFTNGKRISFCGWREEEGNDSTVLYLSEFIITDCETKARVAAYYAMDYCAVDMGKDTVRVYELKWMPTQNDWQWEALPVRMRLIFRAGNGLKTQVDDHFVKDNLSATFMRETLKALDLYIGNNTYEAVSELIGKLEYLALNGSTIAADRLFDLENYYKITTIAATAQHWTDAKAVVNRFR